MVIREEVRKRIEPPVSRNVCKSRRIGSNVFHSHSKLEAVNTAGEKRIIVGLIGIPAVGKVIYRPDAARKRSESRYLHPRCILSRRRAERTVVAERINRTDSLVVKCTHSIKSNV